jgi:putative membrane-bound dehydrogenase-like protein
MLRPKTLLFTALALGLSLNACGRPGPPYSPEASLQTMRIEKGFRIDLFASEPEIADPVAMEFDENGRIFVVEMPGYPLDTGPTGRVKLLEDTDGDGRLDRTTIFADSLVLPTGVMRWKKGILVTAAPDVWYLEDANGDGRADVRRKILTGFAFTNPQHTVNSPVYGLDNWIYLAHEGSTRAIIFKDKFGDQGSEIRFPDRSDGPTVKVERRGVRFRPDTFQLEALAGHSQFGHTFDEWGHYFTVSNENHVRHEVIAARYLQRNPVLLLGSAMRNVSDHGAAAKVFPITDRPRVEMLTGVGQFTAACSLTFYLGGAFPPELGQVSFVAEPAHNLVHRDVWSEAGASYLAKRAQEGVEFLASTDSWFRPVNFTIGPDGAIYLVDYYRGRIEHPEWTADSSQQHNHDHSEAAYQGSSKGRIYRIVPDSLPPLPLPGKIRLGEASDQELVKQLENPNAWHRRTAQRLLVDRQNPSSAELLVRLFHESPSSVGRLHALWTLEGLGKLDTALIAKALADSEPGARENAIRLAEPRLANSPALAEKLLAMSEDQSPKVQFQLLCTLGFLDSPKSRALQNRLLLKNIEDEWMQVAVLSASPARARELFEMAVSPKAGLTGEQTDGRAAFLRQVCAVVGARDEVEIKAVLKTVARHRQAEAEWWRAASLEGLAQGAAGNRSDAAFKGSQDLLLDLFQSSAAGVRRSSLPLLKITGLPKSLATAKALQQALATAADRSSPAEERADAVTLLALAGPESQISVFEKLIDPREPDLVQMAAVRALGQIKGNEVGAFLLKQWKTMTPPIRSAAGDAMLGEKGRVSLMLEAIKNEDLPAWTLSFRQKRGLLMHEDPELRRIARALLEERADERAQVLKRYEAALNLNGDAARGEQVFKNACSKCHVKNGVGVEVGPDLGTVRNRAASLLLVDILMPSKSIAQQYETYVVERKSGGVIDGILRSETPQTIVLYREEGEKIVISRKDIQYMYVTSLSGMPPDLEKQVDLQQMADLLKFLTIR